MRCYRKILHISYKDYVANEEVRAKIQQANGPHENLLTIVKRRKLQWYGHVSRSSGVAKTILQGTVEGRIRLGRQRKRWEDKIRTWTGLDFAKSQRTVENREKWRKLVAKSSVVPQQPLRLRGRWDETKWVNNPSTQILLLKTLQQITNNIASFRVLSLSLSLTHTYTYKLTYIHTVWQKCGKKYIGEIYMPNTWLV